MRRFGHRAIITIALAIALSGVLTACGKGVTNQVNNCPALSGASWVPSITNASSSNHDSTVTVTRTAYKGNGPVVGYAQAFTSASFITIPISVPSDLGAMGSVTIEGQTLNFPSGLVPSAYPVLVSLNDGAHEWINLSVAGGSDCAGTGFYVKNSGKYIPNSSCIISTPGAYLDVTHWEDHNFSAEGTSVNTFPTCNWSNATSGLQPGCPFNTTLFSGGKLPLGTYTAKFLLVSLNYPSIPSGNNADLSLSVFQKKDASSGGAIDLNVVLVGSQNIQDSRTDKGKLNLNLLINGMASIYAQTSAGVKLGTVNAIEWTCDNGGDAYANMDSGTLGTMMSAATGILPSSTETRAVNLFLISSFSDDAAILGEAGAIGGSPLNGTGASGAAFATFNKLATFNPTCTSVSCPATALDAAFVDMQGTVAHETGHFLGLNHPSEGDTVITLSHPAQIHDTVFDTPVCTAPDSSGYITIASCLNNDTNLLPPVTGHTCNSQCTGYNSTTGHFCATTTECAFNHLMWYTSKNFSTSNGQGDGNLISTDSGILINYNPFVQ